MSPTSHSCAPKSLFAHRIVFHDLSCESKFACISFKRINAFQTERLENGWIIDANYCARSSVNGYKFRRNEHCSASNLTP